MRRDAAKQKIESGLKEKKLAEPMLRRGRRRRTGRPVSSFRHCDLDDLGRGGHFGGVREAAIYGKNIHMLILVNEHYE